MTKRKRPKGEMTYYKHPVVEKHVTILEDAHSKLFKISKKDRRSMRNVITIMIEDRYEQLFGDRNNG